MHRSTALSQYQLYYASIYLLSKISLIQPDKRYRIATRCQCFNPTRSLCSLRTFLVPVIIFLFNYTLSIEWKCLDYEKENWHFRIVVSGMRKIVFYALLCFFVGIVFSMLQSKTFNQICFQWICLHFYSEYVREERYCSSSSSLNSIRSKLLFSSARLRTSIDTGFRRSVQYDYHPVLRKS